MRVRQFESLSFFKIDVEETIKYVKPTESQSAEDGASIKYVQLMAFASFNVDVELTSILLASLTNTSIGQLMWVIICAAIRITADVLEHASWKVLWICIRPSGRLIPAFKILMMMMMMTI